MLEIKSFMNTCLLLEKKNQSFNALNNALSLDFFISMISEYFQMRPMD